jgi:hypothetical protein
LNKIDETGIYSYAGGIAIGQSQRLYFDLGMIYRREPNYFMGYN